MELPKISTRRFFSNRARVAQYVDERLHSLQNVSQLTMTITREKSGAYSVQTVIGMSLEDIGNLTASGYCQGQLSI